MISRNETTSRSLVSVKNIDSINASVSNTPNVSPTCTPPPEATSGGPPADESKDAAATVVASTPPASVVCPVPAPCKTQVVTAVSDAASADVGFDLSKVKDEPIDSPEPAAKDVAVVKSVAAKQAEILPPVIPPLAFLAKLKRPCELEEPKPAKRVKPDSKCRTVNITENVTLSLINQSPPADKPSRPASTVVRPKKPVSLPVPPIIPVSAALVIANSAASAPPATRLVYGFSSPSDINLLRTKVTTAPTLLPVTSTVVPVSRPNTKIQPRIVNHVSQTNGALSVTAKPAVTVTPSRSSPKCNESYSEFFNKAMNECLSEVSTVEPLSVELSVTRKFLQLQEIPISLRTLISRARQKMRMRVFLRFFY